MKHIIRIPIIVALLFLLPLMANAQDASSTVVTDDQVNAIAKKLYCPVCENITLDTCGTAACADWRNEIRIQLEAGRTEDEIVSDFVQRFGDRVVGTPQDTALRLLSLLTPWVLIGGVFIIIGKMVVDRRRKSETVPAPNPNHTSTQKYEDLLEQDLRG